MISDDVLVTGFLKSLHRMSLWDGTEISNLDSKVLCVFFNGDYTASSIVGIPHFKMLEKFTFTHPAGHCWQSFFSYAKAVWTK